MAPSPAIAAASGARCGLMGSHRLSRPVTAMPARPAEALTATMIAEFTDCHLDSLFWGQPGRLMAVGGVKQSGAQLGQDARIGLPEAWQSGRDVSEIALLSATPENWLWLK
jgi:hypothetical protein